MNVFKKDKLTERVPLNLTPQEKSVLDALAYWKGKTPTAIARQILCDGMEKMLTSAPATAGRSLLERYEEQLKR